MEINLILSDATINSVKSLHTIMNHTHDKELFDACEKMIKLLHDKVIIPFIEYRRSSAK